MATPYSLIHLDETTSTQDDAREGYEGRPLLVVAASQTGGRGRSGRRWENAPRGLAASLALEPAWPSERWGTLPLVAGLAASGTLGVKLKWPNDLVIEEGKVGGILVEASGSLALVGIGLNLWWPKPPEGVAALRETDPGEGLGRRLAEQWATKMLARLRRSPADWGRAEYREACTTLGQQITWEPDGSGRAVDVAEDGALVIETAAGTIHLRSGEVRTVR